MMKKLFGIAIFLIGQSELNAQQVASFDLYFDSDSYNLTSADKQKVDSVIKTLSNIPAAYSVCVYGHTDNEGDLAYNKKLSLQRASQVKNYFGTKGFSGKNISASAYAFTQPVANNVNEAGKAKNRRVNIKVYAPEPDLDMILPSSDPVKTYSVIAETGAKFKYPSGSEITIPPNAFLTMDGKNVAGKIDIEYTEYRTQLDFIKSGIPMSFLNSDKELVQFNSGGMFKIEASQGDQPLKLKSNTPIKINFAKTQSLPDMKFFAFDSIHNIWTQTDQNVNRSNARSLAQNSFIFGGESRYSIVKRKNEKDSCILLPCTGTLFAARKGLELANSKTPVNLNRAKIYFKDVPDPRNKIPVFSIKIISQAKGNVEFQVIPSEEETTFEEFKDYHWVYEGNKKHAFKKEWEKIQWFRVKMDYFKGSDYDLTFYSNGKQFTISVKAKYKPAGLTTEAVYSLHAKNNTVHLDRVVELARKQSEFDNFFDNYVYNNDLIPGALFSKDCKDSLFCFYQYNRQWMDSETGEDQLSYKDWYDYFNSNKGLMKARYTRLLSSKNVVATECLAEESKFYEVEKKRRREQAMMDSASAAGRNTQMNALNEQFAQLSIKSLGVWNCDQVQRLKEPVYVKKTYKSTGGKKIEPIIIYVIDKEVSGALTYNGYMDLSPYYFPVSSVSENTLIAFDIKNQAYICRPDKMKEYTKPGNSSDIILEFLSKPQEQLSTAFK